MKKELVLILSLVFAAPQLTFGQERYGETEEEQLLCMEALSVYVSYKKQKNLDEAYVQWLKACDACPASAREGIYSDGIRFLKNELKKEVNSSNEVRSAEIRDSIFLLYDQRMSLFPSTTKRPNNRCSILGYKASDYYRFYKDDPSTANMWFKESVECLQAETSAAVISKYYVTSFYSMKGMDDENAKEKLGEMLTDYLVLTDYVETNIALAADDPKTREGFEKAKGNIDEVFIAIAQCEDMVPVLSMKVASDSANMDLKQKVLRLLNKKECTDNDLFLPVATAVHELSPTHSSAFAIGYSQAKNDNFSEAYTYMKQAVEICNDCSEQQAYLLKTGQIASFLKKSNEARRYGEKVLTMDPFSAEALMLIGDAIAGGASACDDGALGSRLAFLRAADFYARAKTMGSEDVAATAGKKLNSAAKQFPSVEEIFAVGKSKGAEIQIPTISGCPCSGESTEIRVR
jgi:tetratricopeptide (TPR) repeat protein